MEPFDTVTSVAAPLLRINIDTDAIIPSREMKRVSKEGLADGLFAGWRYQSANSRDPNPEFVLNQVPFNKASLLVTGRNFGCGSSREHAVWALREWGIRAIIAPSFGSIFESNCIRNGLLPVVIDEVSTNIIADAMSRDPMANPVTVDLFNQRVTMGSLTWHFVIADQDKHMLLHGLDLIALTLKSESAITSFEVADRHRRPWVYL